MVESMVQYPIFLKDTNDRMYKVSKEDELQSKLEINDIINNEYVCWDSMGRHFDIYQEGGVIKVKLADTKIHLYESKQAISNHARIHNGTIIDPNDFFDAQTMFDVIEKG